MDTDPKENTQYPKLSNPSHPFDARTQSQADTTIESREPTVPGALSQNIRQPRSLARLSVPKSRYVPMFEWASKQVARACNADRNEGHLQYPHKVYFPQYLSGDATCREGILRGAGQRPFFLVCRARPSRQAYI